VPSNHLSFSLKINFSNNLIGKDQYFYTHNAQNFIDEICYARTFCVSKDVLKLRAAGFGLGGNLNNAIVVEDNKILNDTGLRCDKEFVKHKILDCIGDFYMSGLPLLGSFYAKQPGHELNSKLLKKIFKDRDNYEIVEFNSYHVPISHQRDVLDNINVA
jgi:UDP-3-O-[3-hydroxymyristoyl] N-acetylglucosamine deacetylase